MYLTKGLVWTVLLLSACGPVKIDERSIKVSSSADGEPQIPNSADQTKDNSSTKTTDDQEEVIAESQLDWDGLELKSTAALLIIEME
jgi:hypothetical protein